MRKRKETYPDIDQRLKDVDLRELLKSYFFENVVKRNDCLIWARARKGKYGEVCHNNERFPMHRVSHALFNGPIGKLMVRHTCDTPACVNPKHLVLGTAADNVADRVARKRSCCGESVNTAKLTAKQAAAIRADRRPISVVAREYGISRSNVGMIRGRWTWKHIP
jgi:hypothetical protein